MTDDLENWVTQAVGLLNDNAETRKHFAAELKWLKQHLDIWRKQEWRVALIGITSSGKSTLVNAFLSEPLLPQNVRPTSNSLVICRRGAKPQGIIHYLDKRKEEILEVKDIIIKRFAELTDEKTNPDNVKEVEEIELFWPHFRLRSNVALIDTPGLDAYGLERHEELTMQMLLPTVDVVVFLTTAKANADGRIAQYLDIIGANGKPVLLVQNMIDSIEPKLGVGGCIERNQSEVAEDHMVRLRKLLAKQNSSVQNAPIIQVSAQWALTAGKLADSRITDLVTVIEEHLDGLKPRLLKGRLEQLNKELAKIVATESSACKLPTSQSEIDHNEQSQLETLAENVTEKLAQFTKSLKNVDLNTRQEVNNLKNVLQELGKNDVERAKELCIKIERWFAQVPKNLGSLVKELQDELMGIAADLNLRSEDIMVETVRLPVFTNLNVPVKTNTKTYRVEKDGFFSFFARLAHVGGYDTRTKTWSEIDIPAFKINIDAHIEKEFDWLTNASANLLNHAEAICRPIQGELKRRSESLTAKKKKFVDAENRLKISNDLEKIRNEIATKIDGFIDDNKISNQEIVIKPEEEFEVQLSHFIVNIVELAQGISSSRHRLLRDEMLQRITNHPLSKQQALIWGFDGESLERFLFRFWSDILTGTAGPGRGFEVIDRMHPVASKIAVALDIPDDKEVDLIADAKKFMGKNTAVFLLLDAEQPGATENQLWHSGLLPILERSAGIIIAIQGIRGLENSDQLTEGVRELKRLVNRFRLKIEGVLANDDNHIASVLVDLLFRKGHEVKTIADEKKWIAKLAGRDADYEKYVANSLRKWRAEQAIESED
jgi:predicted GTPase